MFIRAHSGTVVNLAYFDHLEYRLIDDADDTFYHKWEALAYRPNNEWFQLGTFGTEEKAAETMDDLFQAMVLGKPAFDMNDPKRGITIPYGGWSDIEISEERFPESHD